MAWPRTETRFVALAASLAVVGALVVASCGESKSSSTTSTEGSSGVGSVRVVWQKPASEEDAFGYELLRAGETRAIATELAKTFELPKPLLVRGTNGIGGGPFYNPEDNSITLPYGFATLVFEVESSSNPEMGEEEVGEQVGAVDIFVLGHEFAHALIANFGLPVLGKEEDAADSIATVLLLSVPEGAADAADAASFWAAFSGRQEPPVLADYADTHSLDLQRAFDVLCWVAGSSEASFEEVAEAGILPDARLESCPSEYDQLVRSIERELKPHLNHPLALKAVE